MEQPVSPIIQAAELLELHKKKGIVLVDARTGKDMLSVYKEKHLAGARFADLDTQLADIKENAAEGGRHPLPSPEKFTAALADLGISEKDHVVVYDDKSGSNAAARLWWMLKAVGHKKVQVLDGGMQEAERIGFPVSNEPVLVNKAEPYKAAGWELPLSDMEEVEKAAQDDHHIVVDVRAAERYKGHAEPIDLVAGHIPGAINIPFTGNLDDRGFFLPPGELKEKYQNVFGDTSPEKIIVHCGSGITACHTLLALDYGGMDIPKLYVGSWSEWSRNNKPIATESKEQP